MPISPFDLTQYEQSFYVEKSHDLAIFENLGLDLLISFVGDKIKARQESVVRGYMDINRYDYDTGERVVDLHDNVVNHPYGDVSEFLDVGQLTANTPGSITASCILIAEMIREFVEGPIFERYALMNCEDYGATAPVIGFFHKSEDGVMLDEFHTSMSSVHPYGAFSTPPSIEEFSKLSSFGLAIAIWIDSEVIPCLNNLQFIHRALFYQYPALSCNTGYDGCNFGFYTNMHSNTFKPVDIIIDISDSVIFTHSVDGIEYGHVCIRWASIGSHHYKHADNLYVLATYDSDISIKDIIRSPLYGFENIDFSGNSILSPHVQNVGYSRDVEYQRYAVESSIMNYTFDDDTNDWDYIGHPITWIPPEEYDDNFDPDAAMLKFPSSKIILNSACANTQHYVPPPFPVWANAIGSTQQNWMYGESGIGDYFCLQVDSTMISVDPLDSEWYMKLRVVIFPDCYSGVPYDDGTDDGRGSRWSLEMKCTGGECNPQKCGDDLYNDSPPDDFPPSNIPDPDDAPGDDNPMP